MVKFANGWDEVLESQFKQGYYLSLREFLKSQYKEKTIYPNMHSIFNCFRLTPYENVKAVILGQDPYHGEGQAHGLCFSVQAGIAPPPSLKNIFKELCSDIGLAAPKSGELTEWAQSGVLLLNTILTVESSKPLSHKGRGWEIFTDFVISALNNYPRPLVFMLWGSPSRAKRKLITNPKHLILEAQHPSPLSCTGFFGCRHFSKANEFLEKNNIEPINWKIN